MISHTVHSTSGASGHAQTHRLSGGAIQGSWESDCIHSIFTDSAGLGNHFPSRVYRISKRYPGIMNNSEVLRSQLVQCTSCDRSKMSDKNRLLEYYLMSIDVLFIDVQLVVKTRWNPDSPKRTSPDSSVHYWHLGSQPV